ncbi:type I-E CRISPR-associated protein Cas6/Cse3/CasE [Natronoglycomyces albus]|uniref:Type I-E CRISPR-associated protein Cas6/Cse3/CasE n=1 Tax=Natronoglycomyces albus TaxID=2811108 RepID=A0A895XT92_9ACTN|nr:type I-E CRISPR-associated protein Cas6/Cse3/CasE [Natronoglycomyces albus]QSB06529.1 type I-E CRISPR-associated protein Cas6/Cse3/CasE [Natronoglycomyces albus]
MSPWLTQLILDSRHRQVHWLMADAGRQHKWLMRLAEENLGDQPRRAAGLLYRIEHTATRTLALVQTHQEPRLARLPEEGVTTAATRSLGPLIEQLATGQRIRYRIVANATKRWGNSAPDKAMIGKLHTLRGAAAEQWWIGRAANCGLDTGPFDARQLPDARVRGRGRHAQTQFDGTATIADVDALRDAIKTGIGRSQSFGCGLLSIAPVSTSKPAAL